jgi:hypothetical protein
MLDGWLKLGSLKKEASAKQDQFHSNSKMDEAISTCRYHIQVTKEIKI